MANITLGKITEATFGKDADRGFLFGLSLTFSLGGSAYVGDGSKYMENISEACGWDNEQQRQQRFMSNLEQLNKILTDAKVNSVHELIGKPVEVTLVNSTFKDFRILTEVI